MRTSLTFKENYVRATMPAQNGGEIAILVNTIRGRADKVYTIDSVSQFTRIFGDATSKSAKYALWLLRRGHILKVVTYPYSSGAKKASYEKKAGGDTGTTLYEVEALAPGADYNKVSLEFKIYSETNFGIKVKYDGTIVEEFENVTLSEASEYYIGEVFNSDFVKFTVLPQQVSDIGSEGTITVTLKGGVGSQVSPSTASVADKRGSTDLLKNKEHMYCALILPEESGENAASIVTEPTSNEDPLIKREDFVLLADAAKNQGKVVSPSKNTFVASYYNRVKEPVLGFVDASLEAADVIGNLHIQRMWWKAPAGVENAVLSTAVDLEDELTSENVAEIQEASINPIIARAGVGIVIWGQSTSITDPTDIQRLSTRLLVNYLKRVCYDICLNYMFQENNEFTWSACKGEILPFLNDIANLGGITDQNVICDRTIMTEAEIQAGKMNIQVEFRPVSQVRTIVVNFSVTENTITVEEE